MDKKKFKWILVIAWMAVIFIFSSQPGEVSDESSKFVIYIFNLLGLDLNSAFGSLANFIVRKGAHFTEYFIFCMLLHNAFSESFSLKKSMLFSIIGVFLYACSDEFHQSFVPGRGPAFRDVLVDTSGGAAAMLVRYIFLTFKKSSRV